MNQCAEFQLILMWWSMIIMMMRAAVHRIIWSLTDQSEHAIWKTAERTETMTTFEHEWELQCKLYIKSAESDESSAMSDTLKLSAVASSEMLCISCLLLYSFQKLIASYNCSWHLTFFLVISDFIVWSAECAAS